MSEDPIKFLADDTNLYRYVGNRPVLYFDPTGEDGDLVSTLQVPTISAQVEVGATQAATQAGRVAVNRLVGRVFQNQVLKLLQIAENTTRYTVNIVKNGVTMARTIIPDAMGKAVVEVKNVGYLYKSSQLMAEIELASTTGAGGFMLIIRAGTKLAGPLEDLLIAAQAVVFEFNPITNELIPRILGGG